MMRPLLMKPRQVSPSGGVGSRPLDGKVWRPRWHTREHVIQINGEGPHRLDEGHMLGRHGCHDFSGKAECLEITPACCLGLRGKMCAVVVDDRQDETRSAAIERACGLALPHAAPLGEAPCRSEVLRTPDAEHNTRVAQRPAQFVGPLTAGFHLTVHEDRLGGALMAVLEFFAKGGHEQVVHPALGRPAAGVADEDVVLVIHRTCRSSARRRGAVVDWSYLTRDEASSGVGSVRMTPRRSMAKRKTWWPAAVMASAARRSASGSGAQSQARSPAPAPVGLTMAP